MIMNYEPMMMTPLFLLLRLNFCWFLTCTINLFCLLLAYIRIEIPTCSSVLD